MTIAKLKLTDYHLKPLVQEDAALVWKWRNQSHIRDVMIDDEELSEKTCARWVKSVIADDASDYHVFYHQDRPIGVAGLYHIHAKDRRCEWAFYLGEDDTPMGAGSAMWFLLLDYAFGEKELRRVSARVMASNDKVLRMHERFGFVREGVLRAHTMKEGTPQDMVSFGLLRDEWLNVRQEQWYIEHIPQWQLAG